MTPLFLKMRLLWLANYYRTRFVPYKHSVEFRNVYLRAAEAVESLGISFPSENIHADCGFQMIN